MLLVGKNWERKNMSQELLVEENWFFNAPEYKKMPTVCLSGHRNIMLYLKARHEEINPPVNYQI